MNNTIDVQVCGNQGMFPCTYKTVILKPNIINDKNILNQGMMNTPNTKYVIKYDFLLSDAIVEKIANIVSTNVSQCGNPAYAIALANYNSAHGTWIEADNAYTNNPNDTTLAAKNAAYDALESAQLTLNGTSQYYYFAGSAINIKKGQHITIPEGCVLLNDTRISIVNFDVAPNDMTIYIGNATTGSYDYKIQGGIIIPANCLIEFDGGSISNGAIVGDDTYLIFNQEEDDILKNVTLLGNFIYPTANVADKKDNVNGIAKVYLKKYKSFTSQLTQPNTIYVIQYDFTLGEDITIPANCVLEFDGGSISGGDSNYTITGQNTRIQAGLIKIFNTDVTFAGTWNIAEVYPEWFDENKTDIGINRAITFAKNSTEVGNNWELYRGKSITVRLASSSYSITDTIVLEPYINIVGGGTAATKLINNITGTKPVIRGGYYNSNEDNWAIHHFRLADFSIMGNNKSNDMIYLRGGLAKIHNITIDQALGVVFNLYEFISSDITCCNIYNYGSTTGAIVCDGHAAGYGCNNLVFDKLMTGTDQNHRDSVVCMNLKEGMGITVINSSFEQCKTAITMIPHAQKVRVENCYFERIAGSAITGGIWYNTFNNNFVTGVLNGGGFIDCTNVRGCTIIGNHISNTKLLASDSPNLTTSLIAYNTDGAGVEIPSTDDINTYCSNISNTVITNNANLYGGIRTRLFENGIIYQAAADGNRNIKAWLDANLSTAVWKKCIFSTKTSANTDMPMYFTLWVNVEITRISQYSAIILVYDGNYKQCCYGDYNLVNISDASQGTRINWRNLSVTQESYTNLNGHLCGLAWDTTHNNLVFSSSMGAPVDSQGQTSRKHRGLFNDRPMDLNDTTDIGFYYYVVDKIIPIYWQGSTLGWRDRDGAAAYVKRAGTFADRPAVTDIYAGFMYFATDKGTAGKGAPVYYTNDNTTPWVYADGTAVS